MSGAVLDQWLQYLNSLSNRHLDFNTSFQQARAVLQALDIKQPAPYTVVVTGTNGKGSVVTALERLAIRQGYRVGVTASPHVERYNERIRLQGEPIDDQRLMRAFARVESTRADYCLNYFQFSFLAALVAFTEAELDWVVLEVGVGGRLDACNLIDNQLTIITNVALDHCDKLGDTREAIAREKADLIRPHSQVVLGDADIPQVVHDIANDRQAQVYQSQTHFGYKLLDEQTWQWFGAKTPSLILQIPRGLWCSNAASALQAFALLANKPLNYLDSDVFEGVSLPGRQEYIEAYGRRWLLDVAHNPQAVQALRSTLQSYQSPKALVKGVVAMREDKAISECLSLLNPWVDEWWLVEGESLGLASCNYLQAQLPVTQLTFYELDNPYTVIDSLVQQSQRNDLIVIFGSFILVGLVRQLLRGGYGSTA